MHPSVPSHADLNALAQQIAQALLHKGWMLVTAESCTGGLVAATLTDLAGSSTWFERGFVTYSNAAKHDDLGVPTELIVQHGAVSVAVAAAMAEGAVRHSRAQLGLAITGIAGPTGGSPEKPVGTVCFGWSDGYTTRVETRRFAGDRQAVRMQAVEVALRGVLTEKGLRSDAALFG